MARPRRGNDEACRLCLDIGTNILEAGLLKNTKLQARVQPWTITLDTHTTKNSHSGTTFTRMRAPYVSSEAFRFTIYRKGLFSSLGKVLGMQDIEVGDPEFDDAFIIKSNDEKKVFSLLADPDLRALITAQPSVRLTVRDNEGWFGVRFPEDVDELHCQVVGVITDTERLQHLFALFAALLERLYQIGVASKRDPEVEL